MKKKVLILVILLFAVLLGAGLLYGGLSEDYAADSITDEAQEEDRLVAPDITIYDADGSAVRLSDFRGKPVVMNFWASWCGPCQSEMPDFDAKYQACGDEVHFLMVNMTTDGRESEMSARNFIETAGYSFPVYYDLDGEAAAAYGVYALPTTYFIDAEGYGIAAAQGAINAETLQKGLDMILEEAEK
ncbi:MAG: TlpA family protein disulfide reductase [Ruminococcaceae bacterium]|nr:TlpA family protein disulfide reductase [Oscillospiraceae bacterium]